MIDAIVVDVLLVCTKTLLELPAFSEGNPSVTGFSSQWTRNAELWFVLCYEPGQAIERIVEWPVIWHDAYLTSFQYLPFVRELLNIFYSQRDSDAELRCCLWCQPDHMVEQTVELSLTWDPMRLKWHHCIGGLDIAPERLKCIWNNRAGVNWSTQWTIDTGKKVSQATYVSTVIGNAVYCFYW